jgi:hypothetical protein
VAPRALAAARALATASFGDLTSGRPYDDLALEMFTRSILVFATVVLIACRGSAALTFDTVLKGPSLSPSDWTGLLLNTDDMDTGIASCKNGCEIVTGTSVPPGSKWWAIMTSRFSPSDSSSRRLGVELECVSDHKCRQVGDGPFEILALPRTVGTTAQGRLTSQSQTGVSIDITSLAPNDLTMVTGNILQRLRDCIKRSAITVDRLSEDRFRFAETIKNPEGYIHVMWAQAQVYFSDVQGGSFVLPAHIQGHFESYKRYEPPSVLVRGFPDEQRDYTEFRQRCRNA